ncbi:MAG: tetratricopeptide repeat protein [Candidatus Omnitrophica bacterium]|nr:tetratricopeptide repeat protein [Candidatus Omnitrophota bacterium]
MFSRIFPKFLVALLFSLLVFRPSSFAEDITNETQNLRTEELRAKQASRVAEKSKEKEAADKFRTGVTYEDILKDPDNIELNARYAQEQIARGELLSAAATLERILLVNPNLADVRLLYAVVLYRLDSLNEAGKELETLRTVTLPPAIREQVTAYEKKIKQRKRRTHIGLRQSNGWGYDTNRNAAPSSKFQLVNNAAQDLLGSSNRRADTNFLNISSVDVTHDLGFQAGHSVFGNFTYYLQEQTNVNSLDLGSFQYELGGTYKSKFCDITPSFVASNIFLSSESFLRTQGGNLLLERDLAKKLRGFYNFRVERQDYLNISENTNSVENKGPDFSHHWGASYMIIPTMRWTTSIGYEDKKAKQDYNAYQRLSLNNTHTWLLPRGQFVINSLNVNFDSYETPEFSVASIIRYDRTLRYRITYGTPLNTIFFGKILPMQLTDIIFTGSYEFYRALSNITNYSFTNNKFQLLLTKRLEF